MPLDKQSHLWAGLAIMLSVSLFFAPVIGFAAAICAGLAKEVVDKMGFGTPDPMDFIATAVGACVGAGLYFIAGQL